MPPQTAPCPCPLKNKEKVPSPYRKIPARTSIGEGLILSQQVSQSLPPNTITSPGGSTYYELVERIARIYIDVNGDFQLIGASKFLPLEKENINWVHDCWGIFRIGRTFNVPSAQRLTNIVAIAGLLIAIKPNAIYGGDYFNPHLFREMPHSFENGNKWHPQKKRIVEGEPYPSYLAHVWIEEDGQYRRLTNQPREVTIRWQR